MPAAPRRCGKGPCHLVPLLRLPGEASWPARPPQLAVGWKGAHMGHSRGCVFQTDPHFPLLSPTALPPQEVGDPVPHKVTPQTMPSSACFLHASSTPPMLQATRLHRRPSESRPHPFTANVQIRKLRLGERERLAQGPTTSTQRNWTRAQASRARSRGPHLLSSCRNPARPPRFGPRTSSWSV